MASKQRNEFLDDGFSEESDGDAGYDSEAAERSKGTKSAVSSRNTKRRKLSHVEDDEKVNAVPDTNDTRFNTDAFSDDEDQDSLRYGVKDDSGNAEISYATSENAEPHSQNGEDVSNPSIPSKRSKKKAKEKETKPGVIYLSSLPPYLKPSALRNLLAQRGFEPITRLFLTPASKAKTSSKKNSRQLYTEGWIEFASKKTARRCAESLNAQIVGGRKGGFYHDDLWNMKYLKGMGWSELMAGIREERREEEGRRDEERRIIASETKRFVEGVEDGKRMEGMKRKRSGKTRKADDGNDGNLAEDADVKRTWRQYDVKGRSNTSNSGVQKRDKLQDDAKEVLAKIF